MLVKATLSGGGIERKLCSRAEDSRIRRDDYSRHDRGKPSTVKQFTVQIQELQDRVIFLNDASDFKDLETASSSDHSTSLDIL